VKELATRLSNTLVKIYGLLPGETVSLFATNSIYYPVAMWAALRVGGRVNGASPAYGVDEMVHAMRTAGCRIVFTLPACLEVAVQAAGVLGIGRERVVLLEGRVEGVRSLGELIEEGRRLEEVPVKGIPEGKSNRDVCGYVNWAGLLGLLG
jgi:4-coumarate--CoA ligase